MRDEIIGLLSCKSGFECHELTPNFLLKDLNFDSLTWSDFCFDIEDKLNVCLSSTELSELVYEGGTVSKLIDFIYESKR